jgi:integrase
MNTAKRRKRLSDNACIVPAREKTDFGRGVTELVFRHSDERNLSAAWYFEIGIARAESLGCHDALFCSDSGLAYTSPDVLSKSMVLLLYRMGVFGYTSYSFRHSLIQALIDAGLSEVQVNAYTGHSQKGHTAITWYYHLDKQWAGNIIRTLSPLAKKVISEDGPME